MRPAEMGGREGGRKWNSLESAVEEIMRVVMEAHDAARLTAGEEGDGAAGRPVLVDAAAFRADGKMREEIGNFLVRPAPSDRE